jgi:hypothetical protein
VDKLSTQEFQRRLARVEELIAALEAVPDRRLREQVSELVQTLLDLHGNGIQRILSVVFDSGATGAGVIESRCPRSDRQRRSLRGLHSLSLPAVVEEKPDRALHFRAGLSAGL